jgi:hypothetical protein
MNRLPKAPFVLHPESFRNRRWLYPAGFVEALAEIAKSCMTGTRMDPMNWDVFRRMVYDAEEQHIPPLLEEAVSRPVVLRRTGLPNVFVNTSRSLPGGYWAR